MKKIPKLSTPSLPTAIIISSVFLGLLFWQVQYMKQKTTESQLQIRKEQENREYVSKRKKECYAIEQSERKNYNNVDGSFYNEEENGVYLADTCVVRYSNPEWNENDPRACKTITEEVNKTCTVEKYVFTEF